MKTIRFINLTNGIESICDSSLFIRIQSTKCEQKLWSDIILELDSTFLIHAALGNSIVVYDASGKKDISRAMWQGLQFIGFALNKCWFNKTETVYHKHHNLTKYFDEQYNLLSKPAKTKLKYFRKFLNTENVRILSITSKTEHDGDYEYFNNKLKEWNDEI